MQTPQRLLQTSCYHSRTFTVSLRTAQPELRLVWLSTVDSARVVQSALLLALPAYQKHAMASSGLQSLSRAAGRAALPLPWSGTCSDVSAIYLAFSNLGTHRACIAHHLIHIPVCVHIVLLIDNVNTNMTSILASYCNTATTSYSLRQALHPKLSMHPC